MACNFRPWWSLKIEGSNPLSITSSRQTVLIAEFPILPVSVEIYLTYFTNYLTLRILSSLTHTYHVTLTISQLLEPCFK
jgi:hypothetical protein